MVNNNSINLNNLKSAHYCKLSSELSQDIIYIFSYFFDTKSLKLIIIVPHFRNLWGSELLNGSSFLSKDITIKIIITSLHHLLRH